MNIVNNFFEGIHVWFVNWLSDMLQSVMIWLNYLNINFWDNTLIVALLKFSAWINGIVFVVAFLLSVFDMAEEAGSFKQINFVVMITNFIKGNIFVLCYTFIAQYIMNIANILNEYLPLNITVNKDIISDRIAIIAQTGGVIPDVLALLGFLVASIGFTVTALKRYGLMFIQILTSAFYIPDIVRGETQKIGDWLRQTIAIAFTYTFQFLLFYLGMMIILTATVFTNILLGVGLWLCIPAVSMLLAKFGISSGSKGMLSSSLMYSGMNLLSKK